MAIAQFCRRCDMDIPMLDENEWESVATLLARSMEGVKATATSTLYEQSGTD